MAGLLSGRVKVSAGTNYTVNNYISLNQAQAGLGFTPTSGTGYTLVIGPNGVATFTNTLGSIGFENGVITSQSTTGDLTLNPSGTGTITLNGPVNIPDGIIGSGFKKEVLVASTANVSISTSTVDFIAIDGFKLTYLDRVLIRRQTNPAENGIYYVSTASFVNETFEQNTDFLVTSDWDGSVINFDSPSQFLKQTLQALTSGSSFSVVGGDLLTYPVTLASTFVSSGTSYIATTVAATPPVSFSQATFVGTSATNLLLERSTDANSTRKLNHVVVPVVNGTSKDRLFYTLFRTFDQLGTDPVIWEEIVDSESTQTVINKNLESTTLGLVNPAYARFTELVVNSSALVTSATESTGTDNGALVVAGGVGIEKNLWIGGSTNVAGSLNVLSQANLSPIGATVYIQPSGAGSVVISPSTVGTIDNVDIGNTDPANGTFVNLQATNQIHITTTTNSTSTTTGALVVDGGAGIAGDLVLGGQLIFSGLADEFVVNNFRAKGQVLFTTSTNSTSTTTGGLVVSGGVGIAQDLVLGGSLIFDGDAGEIRVRQLKVTSTLSSTSTTTGAIVVTGGQGIGENLNVGKDVTIGGNLIFTGESPDLRAQQLRVSGTASSTSTTTGALQVAGGVGIGQDLWLGGNLNFASAQGQINANQVRVTGTETSTSTTTGALVVDGGVGVGKDVVIGGNLDLGGQLTFNKSFTATFVALHITSTQSSTAIFEENAVYVEGGVSVKKDLSVYGDAVFTGNLTVLGTQTTVDSQNTYIIDPVIDVGTGINNSALTTNDGLDRGLLLHYNTGASSATDNHAFLGRDNTTGDLVYKYNIYPGGVETFPSTFANTGTYGTARFGGLKLNGGVASVSTITGDLQVAGGIGVAKTSYFGATLTLGSTLANSTQTINHALVVPTGGIGVAGASYFGGVVKFNDPTSTSAPTNGAVIISGGLGLGGGAQIAGPVKITNGTAATSTTTGALQIVGGVGIQGDLHVRNIYTENGQTILFDGGTISQPLLNINTAQSYSTMTGSIVTYGGAGVGKDLWVGGVGNFNDIFINGARVLTTATPTGFNGGTIIYPLVIGYSTSTLNTTGLTVNSSINAVSTDTGAIVTIGGVGIGQDLWVGGTIYRNNDITKPNWGNEGVAVNLGSATFTDNQGSGNFTNTQMVYVGQPTIRALFGSNYDKASTIFIENAPAAGTNTTFGDSYAVWVNEGKVHIASSATSSTNYLNNALSVDGGIGVKGGVQITGDIKAQGVYDTGNRVVSFVDIIPGNDGITVVDSPSGGPTATIYVSNAGVVQANAGVGINLDQNRGTITINNVGVTDLVPTQGIGFSTSTGSVTVFNLGVTSLTAGTDTAVSSTTSNIVIWNTSTLQTITDRGNTTSNPLFITNTETALTVEGTAVLNDVTINGTLAAGNSTFVGSTATFIDLTVSGNTLLNGNVTIAGTATYVNSTQLTVVDPVIDVGTGLNNAPLLQNDGFDRGLLIHYNSGADITTDSHAFLGRVNSSGKLTYRTNIWTGGTTDVPNPFQSTGTLGSALFAGLELQGGIASSGAGSGDLQVTGGVYIGGDSYLAGKVRLTDLQNAISTVTGALQVAGGIGVGKNVYVDGDVIVRGYVLTTATAYNGGEVYNPVVITNGTAATSTLTGALIVHDGGAGIGGDVWVGGTLNATQVLVNGTPITTDFHLVTGPGLEGTVTTSSGGVTVTMTNTGILNLDAGVGINIWNTTTSGVTTVTNVGVTSLATSGPGLRASTSTGSVTLINLGVTSNIAGNGIGVSQSTGSVIITNLGVYSIGVIGDGLTATTSTGSVFLINSGVTSLTAGTDTVVSQVTGAVTVWTTSTLQSITDRGANTTNQIYLDNTTQANNTFSGALQVLGGVGIGKNLYVAGKIVGQAGYEGLNPPAIFVNTTSVTVYDTGAVHQVDVAIANNTTTVFNSTGINVKTNVESTSTGTGAVTVLGGIGVSGTVYGAAFNGPNNIVNITSGATVGASLTATGKIYAIGGYEGLNPFKLFTGTSSLTVVDTGVEPRYVNVNVSGTNVTNFYRTNVYIPVTLNTDDVISTGTITRSGDVTQGAWGTTGVGISVPAATYTDNSSNGVVAGSHVNAFGVPTIGTTNSVSYTNASTIYVAGAPVASGSASISNAWSLYVAGGKVKIADTSASNSSITGALQVAGGVGVQGNINVDGYLDVNSEVMYVGNSEIRTYTSPAITSTSTVNLDIFATGTYQSAKYFIQVVDNTAVGQPNKLYVTELIVYHDGNTVPGVYINEYGMSSNFGDLGNFDAILSGSNIQLQFTPNYVPTSMVIKVHRTTLSR